MATIMTKKIAKNIGNAVKKAAINSDPNPYMAAASRAIAERIPLVDFLVEIRDARVPSSSGYELLRNFSSSAAKPTRIIVMNKADLADPSQSKEWMSHFQQQNCLCYSMNSHNKYDAKQFLNFLQAQVREVQRAGRSSHTTTVMLVGIPNVGKSALANSLHQIGRISAAEKGKLKHATVSPHPGETKDISSLKIGSHPNIYVLDTPGILPLKTLDVDVCSKLALTGAISDSLVDVKELAGYFLAILNLSEKYKKWEKLCGHEDGRAFVEHKAEYSSGPELVEKPKRQYSTDHTQDFIVRDVRRSLFEAISCFKGKLEDDQDLTKLIESQFIALRKAFRLADELDEDGFSKVAPAIFCPIAVAIIMLGNSSVIIGLWPAHFVWSYYCVVRTKKLGLVLKIVVLLLLPVPLILWPMIGIVGSLLTGIGYGIFMPIIATFQAVGENVINKCYHCFADGCWSTIKASCTVVQDLTDFCFHSYFSFMDELIEIMPVEEKPTEIKLSRLPSCFLVSLIGVPVDVLLITAVALWKSPYMLFRGWKRLLEDLIGREGPFLETVCVPFAGLAVLLWPMAVVGAVIGAIFSSFFLGLYGGVIVHQEDSFLMGLAYIISVVSLFDEYVNDLLYLREGSCLPRPPYRRNKSPDLESKNTGDNDNNSLRNRREGSSNFKLFSDPSRTWKWRVNQYKSMQVWDWLFKSCEVNGRIVLRDGLIKVKDIEECLLKGNSKMMSIKLPTWTILQCLLASAKSNSSGFIIYDDVELTSIDGPRDKVLEWFIGPLLIMKEQIKKLQVTESEELCLRKLVFSCKNERPEDWDEVGFPSSDPLRRAQLQAIIRRLQGIVASLSRIPTFRRRFRNLVKALYVEAIQASALGNRVGGKFISLFTGLSLTRSGDQRKYIDETFKGSEDQGNRNTVDIV